MNCKQYPDVDGFYWLRLSGESSFKIVEVRQGAFYKAGSQSKTPISLGQWIGPLMPDNISIYISKQTNL